MSRTYVWEIDKAIDSYADRAVEGGDEAAPYGAEFLAEIYSPRVAGTFRATESRLYPCRMEMERGRAYQQMARKGIDNHLTTWYTLPRKEEMKQYRLTVHHDDSPENPAEHSLFKPHSFSNRHINQIDPEAVTACAVCGDQPDTYQHPEFEQVNDGDWLHADWAAEYREENPEELHKYEPEMEGLFLSYFEHGQCRWGLAGTMDGMPDFRWDGTRFAGFLEFNIPADEREWFDAKSDAEKREMAANFLEEYTDWCNGEAYGYSLEAVTRTECDHGATHEETEDIDSCWGFIGSDYFEVVVREVLEAEGITADNLEIVDEAFGSADYMDFFKEEAKV